MQEPVSLYLDLEPGKKADLEVVGRATIAFAEAVKELAYILDPGLDIKIEFESGTEGSLSLNAIIKGAKGKPDRATLIVVIVVVLGWFASDLRTYGVVKFLDHYLAPEQRQQLSDDDIQRIVRALKDADAGRIAKEPVQQIYRELERDTAIRGVGATTTRERPRNIVPREEFPARTGEGPPIDTAPKKRTKTTTERLTLISPVLLPTQRLWRFKSPAGEFGYAIHDAIFLKRVLEGRSHIPLRANVQITARVETYETRHNDVWEVSDRVITKVVKVHRQTSQADLFSQPRKRHKRKNHD